MKFLTPLSTIALSALMLWCVTGTARADSDYTEFKQLRNLYDLGQPFIPEAKARFDALSGRYEESPRTGALDERGGPDNYGYQWVDNLGGDTATYNWIELRGDAQAVWPTFDNSDDAGVTITLGFPFPFYGMSYEQVRINSNGLIEFTTAMGAWSNQCLPSGNVGGPAAFGFWDDLDMSNGGNGANVNNTIAYRNFPTYTVVEFCSTGHADFASPPEDSYKFEIVLHSNGKIKFQYSSIVYDAYEETQTIGIQATAAGPALQYVCNAAGYQPQNDLAIWFYVPPTGYLTGTVTNEVGAPLSRVAVTLTGTETYATSDGSGEFFFPNAPVGVWDVYAALLGYEPATLQDVEIVAGSPITIEIELSSLPTMTLASTHAPLAITDLDTVIAEINVTAAVDIDAMGVKINNLQHSYVEDLGLWLESPWGERISLSFRHGGSADNYVNTQFDDLAILPIAEGAAPFAGRFLPEEPLEPMVGYGSVGVWKLIIYDHANLDVGTLNSWSLVFVGELSVFGTLSGTVTSEATGEAIAAATVTIDELGIRAFTDGLGFYRMDVPAGTWDVRVAAHGHCDFITENVSISNGVTSTQDCALEAASGEPNVESLLEESFAGMISTDEFEFTNTGACGMTWSAQTISSGWLSVDPDLGSVNAGESQAITVTYDASGLEAGQYEGQIVMTTTALNGTHTIPVTLDLASAGDEVSAMPPTRFALRGSYPNPFNATTEFRYDVARATHVSLLIYNLLGQEVRTLLNGTVEAGHHTVLWDGRDARGVDLSSGLYIVQMKANGGFFTEKSILIR